MAKTYVVVPDTQCKPGVDIAYLNWISQFIVDKKPDVIVHIGDHWDMPSLSSYDFGKRQAEGRRVVADIEAGNHGFDVFNQPISDEIDRLNRNKKKQWNPERHFLLGNHEQRIQRAIDSDAKLEGLVSYDDLRVSQLDYWTVHPFLEPFISDGIAFNHYFPSGVAGKPSSTANAQLNKQHMSCVAGHQQGLQIATAYRGDGKRITSVIAGSAYVHEEAYLGPVGNKHWRGILVLHEVDDGQFDLMPVSMNYLEKKYG